MPAKINSQLVWAKKGAVRLIYNGKEMECQDNNDRKSKLPKEHHSNYHNIMLIVLSKHSKTMMTKTIKVKQNFIQNVQCSYSLPSTTHSESVIETTYYLAKLNSSREIHLQNVKNHKDDKTF